MILLLSMVALLGAPPQHLTKSWKSLSTSKNCGLIIFYSGRLTRYRYQFSKPEKKLIEGCNTRLFPRKLYWFKSTVGEFRFGFPKSYIKTPPLYATITSGLYWRGWVPALRPLARRLFKATGRGVAAKFTAGAWHRSAGFRIMVHEVSREELSRGRLGYTGKPAVQITFDRARAFCKKLGGDLPSEEQWEIAARGGEYYLVFSWGEAIPTACHGKSGPLCGAQKQGIDASIWGVRNLSSSVAEWVIASKTHAPGPGKAITKGGGDAAPWYYNLVGAHQVFDTTHKGKDIGFRCVFPLKK